MTLTAPVIAPKTPEDLRSNSSSFAGVAQVGVLAWLAVALVSLVLLCAGNEQAGFSFVGAVITAIAWVPLALRRISPFSVWGAVALVITIGSGLRGIALAMTSDADLLYFFFRENTFYDLFWPSMVVIAFVALLTAGYLVGIQQRRRIARIPPFVPRPDEIKSRAGGTVIALTAAAGSMGGFLFIRATGGFANSNIRERRATISTIDLANQNTFQSFGHWETLASFSLLAFALYLARVMYGRERISTRQRVFVTLLGLNSLLIPIYTTERAELITLSLSMITMLYLTGRRIGLGRVLVLGFLAIYLASALAAVRDGSASLNPFTSTSEFVDSAVDSSLLNRNLFDLGKALLIIDGAGDELDYANGRTIGNYAFSVVPRAVWPSKPLIAPGPIIGQEIYGQRISGVPPGFAGELVWNFGIWFGAACAWVLGYAIGRLERFTLDIARGPGGAVFLTTTAMIAGRDSVSVGIGRSIYTIVLGAVILWCVRFAIRTWPTR